MDNLTVILLRLVSLIGQKTDEHGDESTARDLFREIETSWSSRVMKQAVLIAQKPSTTAFQLPSMSIPHWHFFHEIYIWFDICQLIIPTVKLMVEANRGDGRMGQSWLESKAAQFQAVCEGIYIDSHSAAAKLQTQLDGPEAVRNLTDACLGYPDDTADMVGTEIRTLIDRPWMESLSQDLLAGWKEALDGIILSKLKL